MTSRKAVPGYGSFYSLLSRKAGSVFYFIYLFIYIFLNYDYFLQMIFLKKTKILPEMGDKSSNRKQSLYVHNQLLTKDEDRLKEGHLRTNNSWRKSWTTTVDKSSWNTYAEKIKMRIPHA